SRPSPWRRSDPGRAPPSRCPACKRLQVRRSSRRQSRSASPTRISSLSLLLRKHDVETTRIEPMKLSFCGPLEDEHRHGLELLGLEHVVEGRHHATTSIDYRLDG